MVGRTFAQTARVVPHFRHLGEPRSQGPGPFFAARFDTLEKIKLVLSKAFGGRQAQWVMHSLVGQVHVERLVVVWRLLVNDLNASAFVASEAGGGKKGGNTVKGVRGGGGVRGYVYCKRLGWGWGAPSIIVRPGIDRTVAFEGFSFKKT